MGRKAKPIQQPLHICKVIVATNTVHFSQNFCSLMPGLYLPVSVLNVQLPREFIVWSKPWSSVCILPPEGSPALVNEQKELPHFAQVVIWCRMCLPAACSGNSWQCREHSPQVLGDTLMLLGSSEKERALGLGSPCPFACCHLLCLCPLLFGSRCVAALSISSKKGFVQKLCVVILGVFCSRPEPC